MFNPSLEWDTLPIGTWNNLGSHSCDCITPTEINEKKEKSYLIYPNPVKIGDNVIVNSIQNIKEIKLIDLFGEKVRVSNQINTSELATGTYIIMIEFMDGEIAKNKLVIQ